jgi:hypothetical protein
LYFLGTEENKNEKLDQTSIKLLEQHFVPLDSFLTLQHELKLLKQSFVEKSAYDELEHEVKTLKSELANIKKLFNDEIITKLTVNSV